MAAPRRPGWGTLYTLTSSSLPYTYATSPITTALDITPEESGEDWWFAHCNLYDGNGAHIGYAAAGYNTFPNRTFVDAQSCFNMPLDDKPDPNELETPDHRKGQSSTWVARYDLDGEQLWCRTYLPGWYNGVTQGHDGSIMLVGVANGNRRTNSPMPSAVPTRYNPSPTQNPTDLGTIDCAGLGWGLMKRKLVVAKVSLDGVLLWNHFYGATDLLANAWGTETTTGVSIMRTTVNGAPGYYVVGTSQDNASATNTADRALCLRLDANGNLVDKHRFLMNEAPALPIQLSANQPLSPLAATTVEHGGKQHVAITGNYWTNALDPGPHNGSFLWHIPDVVNAPYTAQYIQHTGSPQLLGSGATKHHLDKLQRANDVAFTTQGSSLSLVWPIAANYTAGHAWGGVNIASLMIHKFTLPATTPVWSVNKGEIRAYDLQVGITPTSDGHVALVSSKWPVPHTATNDPIGYSDLSLEAKNCLDTRYGFQLHDGSYPHWPTRLYNHLNLYDFWNTDAFVLKVRSSDGATLWETTFDASPDLQAACFPGDLRKQECMYKITEADDGGFVVSGNTSRNFDDAYLVKLHSDCQAMAAYSVLPLDGNGEYLLPSNQTWTLDRNVIGKLVIPAGRTLTISGATIRFADSEQVAWPTQLIIKPGGRLILQNGATLSAMTGCPNSMWDGIQVHGHPYMPQGTTVPSTYQGSLSMSNSTIEHARVGIVVGNFYDTGVLALHGGPCSGGIVQASGSTFRNNMQDVSFTPYENHNATNMTQVLANRSSFTRCTFITNNQLNNPYYSPGNHVTLPMVRGINFHGCTFRNTLLGTSYESSVQQGTGIYALNSSFTVANDCNVLVPYGTPCPTANTTISRFTNLHYGIVTTTVDPGRTFSVSDANFTGTNFGIRMEGIQDAALHRNTFNVPQPFLSDILGATYGVYSDQCTGYSIQENTFIGTATTGNQKVGLVIKDSGTQYNTFYNNAFNRLHVGALIQGKNATVSGNTGLEVKCNDFGMVQNNVYDVRLGGNHVYIQNKQGSVITNPAITAQLKNPAGNRFSPGHNGAVPEADWFVQNTSTWVQYFHHAPTSGNRTRPDHHDPAALLNSLQVSFWPDNRSLACPSRLPSTGGHSPGFSGLVLQEHGDMVNAQVAYDATKDNGDTYSLLSYVGSASNGSAAVRDALISVGPAVGVEVWQAAFERNPTMNAWHLTQALLASSPLQGEVLQLVEVYGLPGAYADLVYGAQNGTVNVLSVLEGDMARHAGYKAEALTDLGRSAWLDTVQPTAVWDTLLAVHATVPTTNATLARGGVLAGQQDFAALATLAATEAATSETPELYHVLGHYANAMHQSHWTDTLVVDRPWLESLGAQRDQPGSAAANAWLSALGQPLPLEVLHLEDEAPKMAHRTKDRPATVWDLGVALDVFPNPANGPVFAAYTVPEGMDGAELRVVDVHGRVLEQLRVGMGAGLHTLATQRLPAGIYLVELRLAGRGLQQAKLIVQP